MVAPELSEPLLLYIIAIADVMSMVLVVERPEPLQPQAPKGASACGSGSKDPNPAIRSQPLEPTPGPMDQDATGS
jgi:hypothetical protein